MFEHFPRVPPELAGLVIALIMSFLRVMYDGRETKPTRIMLEMAISGGLGLAASYAIRAMGWHLDWCIVASCVIAYLGPLTVRAIALRAIEARVGK
jgi:lambda family phage holin